ncbi:MAG: RIP metalloprotease RseP [Burkholderiaceae bacterium]|nr:RIP metalloprotease RseP [Burkholderiaceae bacterium]
MLQTLIAFIVALGLLVAAHEWGHYRVAVACGVKILRFSIGFGPPLLHWRPRRQRPGQDTEFVIGAIPLGGYVKMLDGREGEVAPEERHRAFDTQPLARRALIVAAGPVANLALAVALYTLVNWIGQPEPRAILAPPVAGSLAGQAGLQGGELVRRAALGDAPLAPIASFEGLRWTLLRGAIDRQDVRLEVAPNHPAQATDAVRAVTLPLSRLTERDPDERMLRHIGILGPLSRPAIGQLMPGGAGQRAGLQPGDVVQRIGGVAVADGQQLRDLIRAQVDHGQARTAAWQIERQGKPLTLTVTPSVENDQGQIVGRIGAYVGAAPEMVTVRLGPVAGLTAGTVKTWQIAALTLRFLGRMVIGQISVKNISGPVAIADFAGQAAHLGLVHYLGFLAFISVSLGLMNLLPLPVLDGGHLAYYLWEAVTGKPVAGVWFDRLQYAGLSLLLALMALTLVNDIASRLPG